MEYNQKDSHQSSILSLQSSQAKQLEILLELNRYSKAIPLASQLLSDDPENLYLLYQLAHGYLGIKDYQRAKEVCEKSLAIDPNDGHTHYLLSVIYRATLDFDSSLMFAEKAAHLEPENELFLETLAYAQLQQGLLKTAQTTAKQLILLAPNSVSSHELMGDIELNLDNFKSAESHFRAALRIQPDDTGLINDLARSLHEQKKHTEAIEYCYQALKLDPNNHTFQNNLFNLVHAQFGKKSWLGQGNHFLNQLSPPIKQFYLDKKSRSSSFWGASSVMMTLYIIIFLFTMTFLFAQVV